MNLENNKKEVFHFSCPHSLNISSIDKNKSSKNLTKTNTKDNTPFFSCWRF